MVRVDITNVSSTNYVALCEILGEGRGGPSV